MSVFLINVTQIKTHYSKVIGNEIIIRQVIELGVKMKLEEGQGDHASCFCYFLGRDGWGSRVLAMRVRCSDTPKPVREARCWVRAGLRSKGEMGDQYWGSGRSREIFGEENLKLVYLE